jgi:excinuclease ABC subunit B
MSKSVKKPKTEVQKKSKKLKTFTTLVKTRDVFVSEAIVRPTGLLDPKIEIVGCDFQVEDAINRIQKVVKLGGRVLITTLTKKFAEDLDLYLKSLNIKSTYIHSDVDTIKRIDILSDLRNGIYDVLIGINLLREGLDLPEVSLVCIFDADKEGFLRSKSSLIQIVGRAARNVNGLAVMYADKITKAMQGCIDDNNYKRYIQESYNKEHGITPRSTKRESKNLLDQAKAKNLITKEEQEEQGFEIESRFAQKGKKGATMKASLKASSLENNFEIKKATIKQALNSQKLTKDQIAIKLDIAISEMDFETAAALRDLLK